MTGSSGEGNAVVSRARVIHGSAAVVAVVCLVLGACITSRHLLMKLDAAYRVDDVWRWVEVAHRVCGYLLVVLLIVAVVDTLRRRSIAGWLSVAALVAAVVDAAVGLAGVSTETAGAVLHAFLGQAVVGCSVSAAAVRWANDAASHGAVEIHGAFPLRAAAVWLAPLVALQTLMGALYRHGAWSVLPHMAGAMVVAFLLVGSSVVILQQAPDGGSLTRAAKWTLAFVLAQVLLGIVDFLLRLLDFQTAGVWLPLSVAHVTNGAMVLAVAVVLGSSIRAGVKGPVV